MPDDAKPQIVAEEERRLAEQQRDMAELYPTPELW
jgi:hypothetical protein